MTAPARFSMRAPVREDWVPLGMAQLAPRGFSEQWLLRDCGDRHWDLIARALGQRGTAFRDADGRPVYAAFCATSLDLTPEPGPLLGRTAAIRSELFALGPNRLGSLHRIEVDGTPRGRLAMVSCFLSHDETGSNHRLLKTALPGLAPLPAAPEALTALAARARTHARDTRATPPGDALPGYTPVPALDFNAAGLLYFPVFSKIAEMAAPSPKRLLTREVIYLGNLDPGETIAPEPFGDGLILRTGPGRPLAVITSSAI